MFINAYNENTLRAVEKFINEKYNGELEIPNYNDPSDNKYKYVVVNKVISLNLDIYINWVWEDIIEEPIINFIDDNGNSYETVLTDNFFNDFIVWLSKKI